MPTSNSNILVHNPGGKVRRALHDGVTGTAVFGGKAREYRYRLSRTWDETKPHVFFVMMNPSTADPCVDDPTIAKCCKFARAWGYGGIYVGNTFAYRATDQRRLIEVADPIGPENDEHLIAMSKKAAVVIFAYGKPKYRVLQSRGLALARILIERANVTPNVLRLGENGVPCHPLYLPQTLTPVEWKLQL